MRFKELFKNAAFILLLAALTIPWLLLEITLELEKRKRERRLK